MLVKTLSRIVVTNFYTTGDTPYRSLFNSLDAVLMKSSWQEDIVLMQM